MTLQVPRSESFREMPPGTWWRSNVSVWFRCPNGHYGTLGDHTVADDGMVSPSVECALCPFHDTIQLSGWTPR